MAGILQNLREIHGNGYNSCGNTAGIEFIAVEIYGVCLENVQTFLDRPLLISARADVKYSFATCVAWKNMHAKIATRHFNQFHS